MQGTLFRTDVQATIEAIKWDRVLRLEGRVLMKKNASKVTSFPAPRHVGKAWIAGKRDARGLWVPLGNKLAHIFSLGKTDEWRRFEKAAVAELVHQNLGAETILESVHVLAVYYPPDARGLPDVSAFYETIGDLLEAAKIIGNDRQIRAWDGSRVLGVDRDDPRAQVYVRRMNG